VADRGDVVALAGKLADRFGGRIDDVPVSNGTQMHSVERYLAAHSTGRAVAKGLEG
jgi:hypothetical protein